MHSILFRQTNTKRMELSTASVYLLSQPFIIDSNSFHFIISIVSYPNIYSWSWVYYYLFNHSSRNSYSPNAVAIVRLDAYRALFFMFSRRIIYLLPQFKYKKWPEMNETTTSNNNNNDPNVLYAFLMLSIAAHTHQYYIHEWCTD